MDIVVFNSKYWSEANKKGVTKEKLENVARQAIQPASKLLPPLSPYLNITLQFSDERGRMIEGRGFYAVTMSSEWVDLGIDPNLPFGKEKTLHNLHVMLMHECLHASRMYTLDQPYSPEPLRAAIEEGLSVKFEQDFSGEKVPWGQFEDDKTMQKWFDEIGKLPIDSKNYEYLFDHPDGRRWIIYKTGTWIIQKILDDDKLKFNDLVKMPYQEILTEFEKLRV